MVETSGIEKEREKNDSSNVEEQKKKSGEKAGN